MLTSLPFPRASAALRGLPWGYSLSSEEKTSPGHTSSSPMLLVVSQEPRSSLTSWGLLGNLWGLTTGN